MRLGEAKPGDKTLVDALDPLATSLAAETQGNPLPLWEKGAAAAAAGSRSDAPSSGAAWSITHPWRKEHRPSGC